MAAAAVSERLAPSATRISASEVARLLQVLGHLPEIPDIGMMLVVVAPEGAAEKLQERLAAPCACGAARPVPGPHPAGSERGAGRGGPPPVLEVGDIRVDWAAQTLFRGDAPVAASPKEFDLVCALLRRRGGVATRLELLAEVWGHRAAVLTRTVDTHVRLLRAKIERDPANPRILLTVRKRGYRINV